MAVSPIEKPKKLDPRVERLLQLILDGDEVGANASRQHRGLIRCKTCSIMVACREESRTVAAATDLVEMLAGGGVCHAR